MTARRRISARERAQIFTANDGRCHLCGEKINAGFEVWDVEHVIALEMGGDEEPGSDNLKPAHVKCHRRKSREDARNIAKGKRMAQRQAGIRRQSKRLIPGSKGSGWRQRLTSHGPKAERER